MSAKIPFLVLQLEVEKLYAVQFPIGTSHKIIEDHCLSIQSLIEACGWTTDEYFTRQYVESQGN